MQKSNILIEINREASSLSLSDISKISNTIEKQFKLFAKKSESKIDIHINNLTVCEKYKATLYFNSEDSLFSSDLHQEFVSYCSEIVDFAGKNEDEQQELKEKYTPCELENFGKLLKLINADDAVKISYQRINEQTKALETISSTSISNNEPSSSDKKSGNDNSFLQSAKSVKKDLIVEIKNQEISFSFASVDFINSKMQVNLVNNRIGNYQLLTTRCIINDLKNEFFKNFTKYNKISDKEWHNCKPKVKADIRLESVSYGDKMEYNITYFYVIEIILQDLDDDQCNLLNQDSNQPQKNNDVDKKAKDITKGFLKQVAKSDNIESLSISTFNENGEEENKTVITKDDAEKICNGDK